MMQKLALSSFRDRVLVKATLGGGALLLCAIAGLMVALLPPGVVVRLFALPIALLGLLAVWILPKRHSAPDTVLNLLLWLLVALIHLWPPYVVYRIGNMPTFNPTKLAWLMFVLPATYSILSCREPMKRLAARCKAHPILISAILFLFAWRIISSAGGTQPVPQILGLGGEIVSCYLVFFIVLAVLRGEQDVFRLLGVLLLVALVQAGLASYESFVKHTLFDRFIVTSATDSQAMLDTLREKFRDGHYRAQGTFEHPMVLAEFMAMMVPLAAALFLARAGRSARLAGAAFVPLAIAVIVASRSRSGIAVLLVAVLLVGMLRLLPRRAARGQASLAALTVLLLLPLLLAVGYFVGQELHGLIVGRSHSEASSTMSRVLMLERGIPLLAGHPLLGFGSGMGAVKLGFFDGARFNIDNYWLGLALDSGLPGLLAFAVVFFGAIGLGLRVYRRRLDRAGTTAGLISVSLFMFALTKTVLSISSGLTLAYILIAATIVFAEAAPVAPGWARGCKGRER
jgi:O-antigen ligase